MYVYGPHACRCGQGPEEGTGSPETGVIGSWELPSTGS